MLTAQVDGYNIVKSVLWWEIFQSYECALQVSEDSVLIMASCRFALIAVPKFMFTACPIQESEEFIICIKVQCYTVDGSDIISRH